MMRLLLRALGAAAVLVLSGLPANAQTPPSASPAAGAGGETETELPAPSSAAPDEAGALIDAGRFEEAIVLLRPLLSQRPVDGDVLFLYGLASLEASRMQGRADEDRAVLLDEAIAAFRAMLVEAPGLVRVRLELARAFFLKGEDGLARAHFERVLAGDPPPQVAANVRGFLAEMEARRRWSFHLGAALAPDTNIGASSDARTIQIFGLPFQRDAEDLTTSGIGLSVWGGGEYEQLLGEGLRLRAGADASRREYAGGDFDQTYLSLHAGPRVPVGANAEASVLASARQRWLGSTPDHREAGVRLEAAGRFGPRVTAYAQAAWHDRRYRERRFLDGPVVDVTIGGAWVATPIVRVDGAAGWGRERTGTERWRHRRVWARAGVAVALPYGFTVGGGGELRWTDYRGDWSPFVPSGAARADRTRSLRASVYNRSFTLRGFSPQLALVHEVRDTNAQLYDYRRTGGELRFVRQF